LVANFASRAFNQLLIGQTDDHRREFAAALRGEAGDIGVLCPIEHRLLGHTLAGAA
jgi:hypothetical protein